MGKISRLPQNLANQIAAGEVVERPASVVKELVENAIDAGARRLSIHIELGGKKQVRVEDDGEGMEPDDARLAIERHATSKIRRADDLAAIRTLGFRGEALPSIASVSHLLLRTRARGHESGTEIRVKLEDVAKAKVTLASEGAMPDKGRPGLELFDQPSWGMTDFTQRINYRRALEGELERTVGKMRGIESAKVHIAMQEGSAFRRSTPRR